MMSFGYLLPGFSSQYKLFSLVARDAYNGSGLINASHDSILRCH